MAGLINNLLNISKMETGTLSLASQGRLERPITSSRLHDLLSQALALPVGRSVAKDTPESRG